MTSIGSPSPFFLAGKKAYEVERSLRFDDDQSSPTRLTRTVQSGGNLKKFTVSFWVKRSQLGNTSYSNSAGNSGQDLLHSVGGGNRGVIKFTSADKIQFTQGKDVGGAGNISTTSVFRDVSAWYHICVVADYANSTTADRGKIFVNGVRQEVSTHTNFDNADGKLNTNQIHEIGFNEYGSGYTGSSWWSNFFCGYMAEFYFIDGQAYDPSYFTETNVTTGQLVPKEYTGSFGTTGWYLNFSDNSGTTATTLGKDSSSNSNNWTPNGFSVAAGAGNDSVEDTPTNNFCTLNPITFGSGGGEPSATLSNGNLDFTESSSSNRTAVSTFGLKTGKWYFEFLSTNTGTFSIGWHDFENNQGSFYRNNGSYSSSFGGGGTFGYSSWTTNDIVGVAIDFDSGKIWYAKNNTWQSGDPATGNSPTNTFTTGRTLHTEAFTDNSSGTKSGSFNYGQRPFTYTPPTGYKSICSANLPDPTIKLPNKHFDTVLYTGNGNATRTFPDVLNFQPDWLWLKARSLNYSHILYDAVRGAGTLKGLNTNETRIESGAFDNSSYGFLSSFESKGFSVTNGSESSTYTNSSGSTYVAWNWNAGDTDGKTYTVKVHNFSGNNRYIFDDFQTQAVTLDLAEGGTYIFNMDDSSNASHPFMIGTTANDNTTAFGSGIVYKLDGVVKTFAQYHAGFSAATTRRLEFTIPASTNNLFYFCYVHSGMGGQINTNSTLGSSNFDGSIQTTVKANTTAGFSIVTYTSPNNSSDQTVGHGLGVKPSFIIVKNRDATFNWDIYHSSLGYNASLIFTTASTRSGAFGAEPTSTVYTTKDNYTHASTNKYVAYVFSEVAGYSKFGTYIGNGSFDGAFVFTGFRPAFILTKRSDGTTPWRLFDSKRPNANFQTYKLEADNSGTELTGYPYADFLSNGFKIRDNGSYQNANGGTYVYLAFAESPFKYARAR